MGFSKRDYIINLHPVSSTKPFPSALSLTAQNFLFRKLLPVYSNQKFPMRKIPFQER